MMRVRVWPVASSALAILFALSVGAVTLSQSAETEQKAATKDRDAKKGISIRVDDLPKPIPEVMETMKSVGNNVGKGISEATSAVAEAVKKAIKATKGKEKE